MRPRQLAGFGLIASVSLLSGVASAAPDLTAGAYSFTPEVVRSATTDIVAYVYDFTPEPAFDVSLTMTLPPGVMVLAVSTDAAGGCAESSTAITCTAPGLGSPGEPPGFSLRATVQVPDAAGTLSFDVDASSSSAEIDLENNHATAEVSVVDPYADLLVVISGSDFVPISDKATYFIIVRNGGLADATGVTVDYVLPEGSSLGSSSSGSGACVANGNHLICDLGTIAVNAQATASVTVSTPAVAGTIMTSSAHVSSDLPDPNPNNDDASFQSEVREGSADLSVVVDALSTQVETSGTITFTVGVWNHGPTSASDVTVNVVVPAAATVVGIETDQPGHCSAPANTITCSIPALGSGSQAQSGFYARVTLRAPDSPTILEIGIDASATTPDPVDANNHMVFTLAAIAPAADLSVYAWGPEEALISENVTFFFLITNNGPTAALGTRLVYQLPPGATFVSGGLPLNPCTESNGVVTCSLDTPPWFENGSITITTPGSPGTMTSVVAVSSDIDDPFPDNNQWQFDIRLVVPSADLSVSIVAPPVTGTSSPLSISFYPYNSLLSHITAREVTLAATLPEGLTDTQVTMDGGPAPCTISGTSLACALGDIAPFSGPVITIDTTAPATVGDLVVSATVSSNTLDLDPDNNSASVTFELVTPAADLKIVSQGGSAQGIPGGYGGCGTEVQNAGPTAANHVTFVETVPPGSTELSIGPGCSISGNQVTCVTPQLEAGGHFNVGVSFRLPSPGTYSCAFDVTSDTPDPELANNHAETPYLVVAQNADLGVTMTGRTMIETGGITVYPVQVTNAGPTSAIGHLRVTFSEGVYADPNGDDRCTLTGQTWDCLIDDLSGQLVFLRDPFYFMPAEPATITVTATVESPGDPNPANNSVTITTQVVPPAADLAVTASGPASAAGGDPVGYDVKVTNSGPIDASNVVVTSTLPPGSVVQSIYATYYNTYSYSQIPCDIEGNVITCVSYIVEWYLPWNPSVDIHIEAIAPEGPPGTMTFTASAASQTDERNPDNNSATVATERMTGSADVAVTMEGSEDALVGINVYYMIRFEARGPTVAHDVVITDALPDGMTFGSAYAVVGSYDVRPCAAVGNVVTCDLGSLRKGQAGWISIVAQLPATPGTITNTAVATSTTPDPDPSNNQPSVTTHVSPPYVDLEIALDEPVPAKVAAGSRLDLTWRVRQTGNITAEQVTLTLTLPPGARVVDCPQYDGCPGSTVTYYLGLVQPGYDTTYLLAIDLPAAAGKISVTATLASDQTDATPADNRATVRTKVVVPTVDLSVTAASRTDDPVLPAAPVTLSWRVRNRGDWPANGTTLVLGGPDGTCPMPDGCVRALGRLEPGAEVVVETTVITPAKAGTPRYTATVSSTEKDTDPENNHDSVKLRVVAPIDLSVSIAPLSGSGLVAGPQSYRAYVMNLGVGRARDVTATVELGGTAVRPLDKLRVASTTGSCRIDGSGTRISCAIDELAKGAVAAVTFSGNLVTPAGGQLTATARVATTGPESDLGNNSASFSGVVTAPVEARCADVEVHAGEGCEASATIDAGSTPDASCAQHPAGPYALGTTSVTLICAGAGGEHASCSARVRVVDNAAPALLCGKDERSAIAADNCGDARPKCDAKAKSCVARDDAGNHAMCRFPSDARGPAVSTNADAHGVNATWRADGRFRIFRLEDCIAAIVDRHQGELEVKDAAVITHITSDEGDCADAVIESDTSARLRAAQDGTNGRVYVLFFTVTNDEGEQTEGSCKVAIPRGEAAVEDPPVACVGDGCEGDATCP